MKHILFSIPVFFVALSLYTKIAGPIPFSVRQVTTTKTDLFSVTGTGKISISPDIARVSVGVQETASTVKAAQDKVNTTINKVTESIKKLGIDKKDIKTVNYSINPMYDYTNGKQRITGYTADTDLLIIVRQLDRVNGVIDTATANGANTIGNISFDVEDKQKAENDARKLAVEEAKSKAQNAAKIAGFTLGAMVNYQESLNNGTQPRPYIMEAKSQDMDQEIPETQIEPGSQELTITVTLSYELQ